MRISNIDSLYYMFVRFARDFYLNIYRLTLICCAPKTGIIFTILTVCLLKKVLNAQHSVFTNYLVFRLSEKKCFKTVGFLHYMGSELYNDTPYGFVVVSSPKTRHLVETFVVLNSRGVADNLCFEH